ncbi:hypothetical protein [Chenggangzhangella methanolivorans]|uniref:Uncharacterized protein n=1 Tax=Chenggangzhangella methanolivorans TaxID=1437009 RepID=A0A9E6RET2_9HYPH|nr:hypothetical protein [Chenggangzhangella methanolivorans]QZN99601.1 hypothetical protein K6K41_23360 [Chenggangzhangella methanolivorans]
MLRAILNAIKNAALVGLESLYGFVVWAVNLPVRFFADVAGIGQGVPPLPAAPRGEDADAAVDRVTEALDRIGRGRITAASMAATLDPELPAGRAVHAYAAADTFVRDGIDLSSLSPAQVGWLVTRTEAELFNLAVAGPETCELHLAGERSGLTVPFVDDKDRQFADAPARDEDEIPEDIPFAERLRRFKADSSATPRWA